MKLAAFEAFVQAPERAEVRYLVTGGFAVNVHGYIRLTMHVDLAIALDSGNIHNAFHALPTLGYQPIVPITADAFTNTEQRQRWREEKGMQVLSFYSTGFPATSVGVFVYVPSDFRQEYTDALRGELIPGVDDIQHLQKLQELEKNG